MFSLFIRNLFFTILHPGLVVCLIPYWLIREKVSRQLVPPFELLQYLGLFLFCIGWIVILYCIYRFAVEGRGTLSPADPTKHLVVKGLYQFSRNPMYIGVMIALIGEVIFTKSSSLLIYSIIVFILFNIFIMLVEEPRLKRDFGEEYLAYCKRVRRWL